jgi:UDP-N-acetylmuramoyl-L-alanyl-D-glutamate--2,6-diaminopimelate ligase
VLLHDLLADFELRDHVLELRGDTEIDVGSIVHDSREATPGALFCCIPGARSDGHDHAPAAISAGAVALLVERILPVAVPQARVDSVRRVLGPLCSRFFGHPSQALRVLGVTGTNGKTSTTYLLEAIARANNDRVGVIGTVEARIDGNVVPMRHTTPEATELQALLARMRDQDVNTVAMEVS